MNLIKRAKKNYARMSNEEKAMKLFMDQYLMILSAYFSIYIILRHTIQVISKLKDSQSVVESIQYSTLIYFKFFEAVTFWLIIAHTVLYFIHFIRKYIIPNYKKRRKYERRKKD